MFRELLFNFSVAEGANREVRRTMRVEPRNEDLFYTREGEILPKIRAFLIFSFSPPLNRITVGIFSQLRNVSEEIPVRRLR